MVGEVDELEEDVGWSICCLEGVMDVEEGKLEEELVDKPRTMKATYLTCCRRRKSACWTNSWQVFPNIFRSNFGEDITDFWKDCVDVQWLLALVVGGNPSDSPRRSSWTSPRSGYAGPYIEVDVLRTWFPPINFNCPSAVFGIVTYLGEIISFALSFYVVEFLPVYFVHLLKVWYHKSSFPNFSPRVPDVFEERFGQCCAPELVEFQEVKNRNGVIFIPTNQIKFFDSTDSSKPLSLVFFADSCNSSWIPSTVEWSIATVTVSTYTFQSFHGQRRRLMPNSRKWFHVGLEKFCFITDLWAAKFCTTIAYRWLTPDSQVSIKTLCSAVVNSPKFCCSRYGFSCASLA